MAGETKPATKSPQKPPQWQIYLAFAAVYIIWGSTYLAMRFTNETIPPFLMSGMRFIIAGVILYAYVAGVQKAPKPTWPNIKGGAIIGFLLILIGNGGVAFAELTIPSSIAALVVAMSPVWFTLLGWLFFGTAKPNGKMVAGLILGFIGMIVLIGPGQLVGHSLDNRGLIIIVIATLAWSTGSLYSATAKVLASPLQTTAIQMLVGGALLLLASFITGELTQFQVVQISAKSFLAFGYLIVFGSLIGYTSYSWLIRVVPPSQASTYAYVNPVVAVLLGWLFGGESVTIQMLLAGALILAGVIMILKSRAKAVEEKPVVKKS